MMESTYSRDNKTCCVCGRKTRGGLRLDSENNNFCYEHRKQMKGKKEYNHDEKLLKEFGL